ncbi:hypothetical protein HMPREF0005_05971, partial [Achromobacter xylosoxidans C54]
AVSAGLATGAPAHAVAGAGAHLPPRPDHAALPGAAGSVPSRRRSRGAHPGPAAFLLGAADRGGGVQAQFRFGLRPGAAKLRRQRGGRGDQRHRAGAGPQRRRQPARRDRPGGLAAVVDPPQLRPVLGDPAAHPDAADRRTATGQLADRPGAAGRRGGGRGHRAGGGLPALDAARTPQSGPGRGHRDRHPGRLSECRVPGRFDGPPRAAHPGLCAPVRPAHRVAARPVGTAFGEPSRTGLVARRSGAGARG